MKAKTLVEATLSYQLGHVRMSDTNDGVLLTAGKDGDPIGATDVITAAAALQMSVYFTYRRIDGVEKLCLFVGDQYELKNEEQ